MNIHRKILLAGMALAGYLAAGATQAGSLAPFGDPLTGGPFTTPYLSYQADYDEPTIFQGDPTGTAQVLSGGSPASTDIAGGPLGNGSLPDGTNGKGQSVPFGAPIGTNSVTQPFTDGVSIGLNVSSDGDTTDEIETSGFIFADNGTLSDLNVLFELSYDWSGSADGSAEATGSISLFDLLGNSLFTTGPFSLVGTGSNSLLFYLSVPSFVTNPSDSFNGVQMVVNAFGTDSGTDDAFDATLNARLRVIPEPATLALFGLGLMGMAGMRKRAVAQR